jgi:hypothetical protein
MTPYGEPVDPYAEALAQRLAREQARKSTVTRLAPVARTAIDPLDGYALALAKRREQEAR